MAYDVPATSQTPALVVYLIDVSGSMDEIVDGASKIQHVNAALHNVLKRMVRRSTKAEFVSPRYRLAMYAYSTEPTDILQGVRTITEVAQLGSPELRATNLTDTAAAFMAARDLLHRVLPSMRHCPAPMVCHFTDGHYTGADPEPFAREIMEMSVHDGNVLVENIYAGNNLTRHPIGDARSWKGIRSVEELTDPYVARLFRMSSRLPERYAEFFQEEDEYSLEAGAAMLFPASNRDLIELAFAMSGATPTGRG